MVGRGYADKSVGTLTFALSMFTFISNTILEEKTANKSSLPRFGYQFAVPIISPIVYVDKCRQARAAGSDNNPAANTSRDQSVASRLLVSSEMYTIPRRERIVRRN